MGPRCELCGKRDAGWISELNRYLCDEPSACRDQVFAEIELQQPGWLAKRRATPGSKEG